MFKFHGKWLLLVTDGGPTEDKPAVTFAPPGDPNTVSHQVPIRVPDCRGAHKVLHKVLRSRGTEFLPPAGGSSRWGPALRS